MDYSANDYMQSLICCIAVIIFYFLPTINAFRIRHMNSVAILMLNLFLGWTVIGWIIALIWSCTVTPTTVAYLATKNAPQLPLPQKPVVADYMSNYYRSNQ